MEGFSYKKVGVVDVDVTRIEPFKEELAWAVDKRLWIISTIKSSKTTKELKGTSRFKFKATLYTLLCDPNNVC